MQRALAVLGAVAMVVAAVVGRNALDDDGTDRPSDSVRGVVICAADLMDYCEALPESVEVRAQDAAATASAIRDGTLPDDVGGWITTSAWLEVVASRRQDAVGDGRPLARSPVVLATAPGRDGALADLCAGDDVWACLGGAAGRTWGELGAGDPAWRELEVGVRDPDGAGGLSVLAGVAVGWFGGTDFAANDLDADFADVLTELADASAGDEEPARTMAVRPGQYSAAGTLAQVAAGLEGRGVSAVAPQVEVSAVVVVVALGGGGLPAVDGVEAALRDDGWLPATESDAAPTLKPGVLAALHSLWKELSP